MNSASGPEAVSCVHAGAGQFRLEPQSRSTKPCSSDPEATHGTTMVGSLQNRSSHVEHSIITRAMQLNDHRLHVAPDRRSFSNGDVWCGGCH